MMIQQQLPPPKNPLLLHIPEPPMKLVADRDQPQSIVCGGGKLVSEDPRCGNLSLCGIRFRSGEDALADQCFL